VTEYADVGTLLASMFEVLSSNLKRGTRYFDSVFS
jgi:hypothetical protein